MKTYEFTQAFVNANQAVLDNVSALVQTHALRMLIAACEERITELSDEAIAHAAALLNDVNKTQGEFAFKGCRFQLQRTAVYDMTNASRYKGEDCIRWRSLDKQRTSAKQTAAALTKQLKGITDAFVAEHPDWEPDEEKLTLKCLKEG